MVKGSPQSWLLGPHALRDDAGHLSQLAVAGKKARQQTQTLAETQRRETRQGRRLAAEAATLAPVGLVRGDMRPICRPPSRPAAPLIP